MRHILVGTGLLVILITIICIFWQEEFRYSLPTPIPEGYQAIPVSHPLEVQTFLPNTQPGKALHLLFFNPECPCSRFTAPHVRSLKDRYQQEVTFVVVLPVGTSPSVVSQYFGPSTDYLIDDQEESIATRCGVYASPQAVLIDRKGLLYYRGNYNKARFCTQAPTSFAQLALTSLLEKMPPPQFGPLATTPFGCQLPQYEQGSSRYQGFSISPI
ncbi:MAG: AhpC/TSA family protein [Bacteroidota bacterium]